MKKKIVALLCAAALAFGIPATAFGDIANVEADRTAAIEGPIALAGGSLQNIRITNVDDSIKSVKIQSAGDASKLPTNALPGSGSACTIAFCDENGNAQKGAGRNCALTLTYRVNDAVFANLPTSVPRDNLYIAGTFYSEEHGATVPLVAHNVVVPKPNPDATLDPDVAVTAGVSVEGLGSGTLTLWMQAGKLAASDALVEATPVPDSDDSSSDDGPRYIDGMPELNVAGTSGVVAWGNLAGANIPAGAVVSISANTVSSGVAYNELRAAMGSGRMLGAFQVDLDVNGKQIHNGFGELNLAFPMPYGFEGRTVTVWHRHNDGSITSQVATVTNGEVRITTRDLSEFAIELGAPVSDDANVSPKTGQDIPAGTPLAALGAVVVLGVASVLFAKRKMMR